MIFCQQCGTENESAAKFCKTCGGALGGQAGNPYIEAAAGSANVIRSGQVDAHGRVIADDGLPVGTDLDGEPGGERILWEGRPKFILSPWDSIRTKYRLTNERLMVDFGIVSRRQEEIELFRVNDVGVRQGVVQRIFGTGNLQIESTDATNPNRRMKDVSDPDRVKDVLRQAARAERQRRRVLLRDEV